MNFNEANYRLTANELALWLHYIEHQVGFVLPSAQENWVKGIIERHLAANRLTNTELLLRMSNDEALFHQVFDDILIPRTQFFRHPPSFTFIEQYTRAWETVSLTSPTLDDAATPSQPSLANERPTPFVAWSVGCATGQEAVSMGLVFKTALIDGTDFQVYGMDYHQKALQQARLGEYELRELQDVPLTYQHWLKQTKNKLLVPSMIQSHLHYVSLNLIKPPQQLPVAPGQCQLILCNNVLIYFRQFEQRDIIKYLSNFLAADGVLLLGVGEVLQVNQPDLMRLPVASINAYCKRDAPDWVRQLTLPSE